MLHVGGVTGKLYGQHISLCPIPMVTIALSLSLDVLSNDEETLKFSEHF